MTDYTIATSSTADLPRTWLDAHKIPFIAYARRIASLLISFCCWSILYLRDYVSTMQACYQVYDLFFPLRVLRREKHNGDDESNTCDNVGNQQTAAGKGQMQDRLVRVNRLSIILRHCRPPFAFLPGPGPRPCYA